MFTDIGIDKDGDLILTDGDFKEVTGYDFYKQCATNRIKSIQKDWHTDHIGADLEEILGMPNTQDVAEYGSTKILTSLVFDGLFDAEWIKISPKPLNKMTIAYDITIRIPGFIDHIKIEVSLDLTKGISIGGE